MRGVVIVVVYLTALACANGGDRPAAPIPHASASPGGPLVIFLGDSLTAGYGLAQDEAFPAVLERAMRERGMPMRVVNAGVSGDTTTGGLDRLDWLLKQKPDLLVIGLGANDALRGQDAARIEENLRSIIASARHAGARVLLLGMRVPANYGPAFTRDFAEVYPRVARAEGVALVPFLLEGVGGHPELNLDDGIHPNTEGQAIVARNILPYLERAVRERR